jgi:hypothetical protein
MSKRVKAGHNGSRRDADVPARALKEYQEAVQRREQWAAQQATREQIADLARQQGWRIEEEA